MLERLVVEGSFANWKFKRPRSLIVETVDGIADASAESRGRYRGMQIWSRYHFSPARRRNKCRAVTRFRSATWPIYCRVTTFILSSCHVCSKLSNVKRRELETRQRNIPWPFTVQVNVISEETKVLGMINGDARNNRTTHGHFRSTFIRQRRDLTMHCNLTFRVLSLPRACFSLRKLLS